LLFNQPNLPRSIPLLQPLFTLDRVFRIIELFEIDEPHDVVFLRETLDQFRFVLEDATNEVIGHANVQRATGAACEDADVIMACAQLPALGYWIARSSRATVEVVIAVQVNL
jgi:hypothetical protein